MQLAKRSLKRMITQNKFSEEVISIIKAVQGFLDRADRQTHVQSRLVSDLLDATRIQTDQLELHITRCDLMAIVGEAIENQLSITPTRTIRFERTTPNEVFVLADADRLGQVVSNYLSNALKFSEASHPVDVSLQATGTSSVRLSVHDEGPGLSPDQQKLIWERFYRVDNIIVKSGSGVGLGLGLYICQTIIERQGGQVGVVSQPDQGSTFWFTFPTAD